MTVIDFSGVVCLSKKSVGHYKEDMCETFRSRGKLRPRSRWL